MTLVLTMFAQAAGFMHFHKHLLTLESPASYPLSNVIISAKGESVNSTFQMLEKNAFKSILFLCIRANAVGLSRTAARLPFLPENAILSITRFFTKNQKGEICVGSTP